MDKGLKPEETPMAIDLGGGTVQLKHNRFPTLTVARCSNRSYWSTEMKRKFKMEELMRGQGCNPDSLDVAMLSERARGRLVGNAIAVPVFRQIPNNIMIGLSGS